MSNDCVVSCVSTEEAFRRLEGEWNDLFLRCADATVFNSWQWLMSWWEAYGSGELCILCWREPSAQRLVAVAPLYVKRSRPSGGLPARTIRLIGDGSFDSDYLDVLVERGHRQRVLAGLFQWLDAWPRWDVLVLDTLPAWSGTDASAVETAMRHGLLVRTQECSGCSVRLPGSFDEFLAQRKSRFRTKIRSLLRRFDESGGRLEFECDSDRDFEARLDSLFELHQQRWQSIGEPGVFGSPEKRRFYALFTRRFRDAGWLRFYSLRDAGRYVAHQMCFGRDGRTMLLQEGFDATQEASYGQMLRAVVFRNLIESGATEYDFLAGVSRNKTDWGASLTCLYQVTAARNSLGGQLFLRLPQVRAWAGRLARRMGVVS